MTEAEIVAAIRANHLKANIGEHEAHRDDDCVIHWDRAYVDPGGTIFGPGPYLKVPVSCGWFSLNESMPNLIERVYPPARLRKKLALGEGIAERGRSET